MYQAHPPPTGRCWFTHSLVPFSPWHTDYSHSHSDPQTTSIITQTHRHRLHQFLYIFTDYSTLTNTHLLPLYSHRHTDYSHSPQTHRLFPFSLRHTDYSHSHSDTKTSLILTQTTLIPLRNTDYSHSHSHTHTDWQIPHSYIQTSLILSQTHRLLSFSHRHTANSQSILIYKLLYQAHPPPTGRCWLIHRLLSFHSDTKTTAILTQAYRLLPFSLRHIDYSHSLTVTQTFLIFIQTHRLLSSSFKHTDYSHSTLTHRLLPFSLRQILYSYSHTVTRTTLIPIRHTDSYCILTSLRHSDHTNSHSVLQITHSQVLQL